MSKATEARHRIGAVVRLTGISAHALRAWDRRYGAFAPERTDGGDRLYSESDVRKLRLIKRLNDYGHSIGDIVRLDEHRLELLLSKHTRAPEQRSDVDGQATIDRYLDALTALDLETAERVLQGAAASRGPRDFMANIAEPLLITIGVRWQTGALCVANEHAASAMLRTHLGRMLSELPVEPGAPCLLSTTPAGERHEFGALFAAIIAGLGGWRAVYLGPDLPASEIALAARTTGSRAVLVSVVSLSPRKARAELDALARALPSRIFLVVGGSGAADATRGLTGLELQRDLVGLGNFLAVPR